VLAVEDDGVAGALARVRRDGVENEMRGAVVEGREEGEAEDVIPVTVRDEEMDGGGVALARPGEGDADGTGPK